MFLCCGHGAKTYLEESSKTVFFLLLHLGIHLEVSLVDFYAVLLVVSFARGMALDKAVAKMPEIRLKFIASSKPKS